MSGRATPRDLGDNGARIRKDGRCLVCGKERPTVAVTNRDPFCSAVCSRKHHGTRDVWVMGRDIGTV
jgi:selenophosphate synthetase-related protein